MVVFSKGVCLTQFLNRRYRAKLMPTWWNEGRQAWQKVKRSKAPLPFPMGPTSVNLRMDYHTGRAPRPAALLYLGLNTWTPTLNLSVPNFLGEQQHKEAWKKCQNECSKSRDGRNPQPWLSPWQRRSQCSKSSRFRTAVHGHSNWATQGGVLVFLPR